MRIVGHSVVVCTALLMAAGASALELAGWRGETVSAWLGEKEQVGPAPAWLAVRVGAVHEVMYATAPKGRTFKFVRDRVAWDGAGAASRQTQRLNAAASGPTPRVLQVRVAPDAKPGVYTFGDVTFRVVDRVLPPAKDWQYYLDLWQHPWAVARFAQAKPFSKEHYAAMKPVWELLASAGQKTITVSIIELPWDHQCYDGYHPLIRYTRRADGSTAFDFSTFDEYVAFCRACGLGPHISCYSMCPWGYRVSWFDEQGALQRREAKPGTPFFAAYWGPYLKAFAAHLKEKGWLGDTFMSLDERSPEDLRNTAAFVRATAPGLRIAMAGNRKPSEFTGIEIDSYSQSLGHVNKPFLDEVGARRAAGQVTTYYICCGPGAPNTFAHSGLDEAFWCGAYPAMCGLDGLLRWAWNSWPQHPNEDLTFGPWPSGDTFLAYPGGQPSMRFLALLNGIQQAEKFNLLKKAGGRDAELAALAERYKLSDALGMKPGSGALAPLKAATLQVLNK